MINHRRILARSPLFILTVIILFVVAFIPGVVRAATPARCQVNLPTGQNAAGLVDCSSIGVTIPDTNLEQDKCYNVTAGADGKIVAQEQPCGAAQCQQNTALGSTPAGNCPDYSSMPGATPMLPGHCYVTTLGDSFSAEEKSCLGPPFAKDWTVAACRDGTFQQGSATTADKLCATHDGAGAAIYVQCQDGTSQLVSKTVEHQGKQADLCSGAHGGTKTAAAALFNGPIAASVDTLPKVSADQSAIVKVLQIVFSIAGAIAVLMITISGFKYTMSMGDPNKTARAKDGILYALIGLALVVVANFAVIYVVNNL